MLQAVPMGIHAGQFHHGCHAEGTHVLQLGYSSNCWLRERWSGRIHSHHKIQYIIFQIFYLLNPTRGGSQITNMSLFFRKIFVCQRLAKRLCCWNDCQVAKMGMPGSSGISKITNLGASAAGWLLKKTGTILHQKKKNTLPQNLIFRT